MRPVAPDRPTRIVFLVSESADRELAGKGPTDRDYLAGDYSIADMACYPWIVPHASHGQDLREFPRLKQWFERIESRPATQRAYEKGKSINPKPGISDEAKQVLFGQSAKNVR